MSRSFDDRSNSLLLALPAEEFQRVVPRLERVDLSLGSKIYDAGEPQQYAYFPTTAIVSLLYFTAEGSSTELAVIGREGVVGITLFMGGNTTNNRAVVQSAGTALRMPASLIEQEFRRGGVFQRLMLNFTQALMSQMTQTAVCNSLHSLDQQFCRWLLIILDRLQSNPLRMTQQLIADMLGVRRESVTAVASRLQADGAIQYTRGEITVIDRSALKKRVCECYGVVDAEYTKLLHDHGPVHEMHSFR